MKKLLMLCMVAVLTCFAASCNTEVPTSEIAPMLNLEMRCGMTGGVPLHESQAAKIKAIVNIVNYDLDHPNETGLIDWTNEPLTSIASKFNEEQFKILLPDYNKNKNLGDYSLEQFIFNIHASLKGGRLLYGSAAMASVYKYAYAYLSADDSLVEDDMYCACGYQFCEKGSACSTDDHTKLPICASNTTIVSEFTQETLECNPIKISKTPLRKVLIGHVLPILVTLGKFKSYQDKVVISDKVKTLVDCTKDVEDKEKCELAQKVYSFAIECINIGEDGYKGDRNKCVFYNPKDNTETTDDGKVVCKGRPCMGELYIAGIQNNYDNDYYTAMRKVAEVEITNAMNSSDEALAAEAKIVDINQFMIDQVTSIFSGVIGDMSSVVGQVAAAEASGTPLTDDQIFSTLRDLFNVVYENKSASRAMLHRQFFSWMILSNMSTIDIASLYTSTLTVRLECEAQNLPNGDISGLKKYCIYRDNLLASINDILTEMQKTKFSVVQFADAMIMNKDVIIDMEVHDKAGKLKVDINKMEMFQSFPDSESQGDDFKQMLGDWFLLRCPSNASCMLNNQCGSCTNGMRKVDSEGKLQVCANGIYTDLQTSKN